MSLHLHAEPSGRALFLEWFLELPGEAQDACFARLERLGREGWEAGPPLARGADELRELVLRHRGLELRVPFFFHGRLHAVLSHGRIEGRDPGWRDAAWLLQRRAAHRRAPERRTFALSLGREDGRSTRDALRILAHVAYADPARWAGLERAREALELSLALGRSRAAAGLGREELALRIGVSPSVLAELEEGDAHALSFGVLRRVAEALGRPLRLGPADPATATTDPPAAASRARGSAAIPPAVPRAG